MSRIRRQSAAGRHAAGRWMEAGAIASTPDEDASVAGHVVSANGVAYRALLEVDGQRPRAGDASQAEVPEERWRRWLVDGVRPDDRPQAPLALAGAHRLGRRWERPEDTAGPLLVRAERSSLVASRLAGQLGRPASASTARHVRRSVLMAVVAAVVLGIGLSAAGWRAQSASLGVRGRVASVVSTRQGRLSSAVMVEGEV
jgi:hypothetical protein